MSTNVGMGIAFTDTPDHACEPIILLGAKWQTIATLKLDANGKIIAALATFPDRHACMPGTRGDRYELQQAAVAPNEEVRGNTQSLNAFVIGMFLRIELIGKQLFHTWSAKLVRRQADGVNDHEVDSTAIGPLIAIG